MGRFMKNFRFNRICKITQEPQELHRACRFIGKSAVIMSSIAIKRYKFEQEIAFWPGSNSFLLYPPLILYIKRTLDNNGIGKKQKQKT